MDKDSALGWVILAGAGYLGYNMLRNRGNLFSGLAASIFGQDVVSGKFGEQLGNKVWSAPLPGSGVTLIGGGNLPYNSSDPSDPSWNANYATGYESWASFWNRVPQVNVLVTDKAFAKIGLNTAQVEWLQMHYPKMVNSIVMKLTNGQALSQAEAAAVNAAGGLASGFDVVQGRPYTPQIPDMEVIYWS